MSWVEYENKPFRVSASDEAFLAQRLRGHLQWTRDGIRITHLAGHIAMPGGRVLTLLSRKADSACILSWLGFADPSLSGLRMLGSLPHRGGEGDLGSLIARVFCVEAWRAIQTTGLLRAYHRHRVDSSVIRGRIDFAQIGRRGSNPASTPCILFSRLPATPLNRLLAAAVHAIARDPWLRQAAGASLPPLAAVLAEISPAVDADLLAGKRPLSRLEQPFSAAVALAAIVLHRNRLATGDALTSASFTVNLATLFERAVARAISSAFDAVAKHPVHVYRTTSGSSVRETAVPMEIDIYVRGRPEPFIIDAKYKHSVSSANLHQMAAYAWLTGTRRAVLVLPKGQMDDRRSFLLPRGDGASPSLRIDIAELDVSGRSHGDWQAAARQLVGQISG